MKPDLVLRGARLVGSDLDLTADLSIRDGKIAEISSQIESSGAEEVDLTGHFVLPGYIDAHVHLNEPGRETWEGFTSGTAALAAGGCTSFLDMPLNSTPVLDRASFEAKAQAFHAKSRLDGALWGGLVPGHLGTLPELAACGVIGFKAFMSASGLDDFPRADRTTLREGMARAAELGLPVAVHAEDEEMTSRLAQEFQARGACQVRDYLDSRPILAELNAVGEALDLARETGCALHVVHVSSAAGLKMIAQAKAEGVDVTAETCPHYLLLNEADVLQRGAVAKCAPPLRSHEEQEKLWAELLSGHVDTIGSDHSPAPPDMKTGEDFFRIWGGIAGAQHNYPLLFAEAVLHRDLDPRQWVRLTSTTVAQRFRLAHKGDLRVGWDADLVAIKETKAHEITSAELLTRHRVSAYVGCTLSVEVAMILSRGVRGGRPGAAQILRPSTI